MISEELATVVLVTYAPEKITVEDNTIVLHYDRFSYVNSYNIHELAHKCKEWAVAQKLHIQTNYFIDTSCKVTVSNFGVYDSKSFLEDTEPEAIFKACEWIVEQKTTT